jgi:hypothetical protein
LASQEERSDKVSIFCDEDAFVADRECGDIGVTGTVPVWQVERVKGIMPDLAKAVG